MAQVNSSFDPDEFDEGLRLIAVAEGHGSFVGGGPGLPPPDAGLPGFLHALRDELEFAIPGLTPIPSRVNAFPPAEPIGSSACFDPAKRSASFRFWFEAAVVPNDEVFGFEIESPPPAGIAFPVSTHGRYDGAAWRVHVTLDALDVLIQLGVRAMGRPVAFV